MEKYLLVLPQHLYRPLCKFRTCNNRLPIQQGKYSGIDKRGRCCTLRDCKEMGMSFFICFEIISFFEEDRHKFISRYHFVRLNTLNMD